LTSNDTAGRRPSAVSTAGAKARRLLHPIRQALQPIEMRVQEHQNPVLGWLRTAARRQPSDPDVWDRAWDNRRRLVRSLAPGRSFIDVGGMFGVSGELAFLAEECGATRCVLFDAMDPTDEFAARHSRSSSGVQHIQGDLHDPEAIAALGTFDVVWCTGVLYHSPNPMFQLMHLRQLTTETMVLGNLVIPEVPGFDQVCILYPGIPKKMQDGFAEMYGGPERFPGMAVPFDATPNYAYANMWWGITPSAMRSMMRFTGLDIIEEYLYLPFCLDIVAKVGGESLDIYPPLDFCRERARRRYADTPQDQLPRWAEAQMDQFDNS
jgi:hypothetical protein